MASYTQIDKLIEIAENRSVRTILLSSVSAITLAGCMGGGGGGTFGVFGGGSGAGARLAMGGQLVKGTVVGARVFQDVDGDGTFDNDGTENSAITDSTGAYSLELNNLTSPVTIDTNKPGIDVTTGASPGKIIVNPVNQTGIVSTPLSFLGDEYGSTSVNNVLTNMPAGIDISTYDPIDEIKSADGDNTSSQYQIAEQVDALAAQTQVIINSIEKMLSSSTVGSSDPLGEAKKSIIDGHAAKGGTLDLGSTSDVQTILNASPLASVPGFENIISSLSTAISSVNTQIWTTQNTGDLFGDGRSIMLVAQDNLNSSLDELAASPSAAVAGQIAQAYSGAQLNSLETAATNSLPTFNPATGVGANVLPSIDKATVTQGQSVTVNVLNNDIALDGEELSVTAISATNVKNPGTGLSPLMAAVDNTVSVNPINSALSSASANLATLNSDGTITFTPDAVGRYTIYYQAYDGSNPAVGSLVIDSVPSAPTISLNQSAITLSELKDGSAGSSTSTSTLSLDFGNIITINDSGGTVLLSYRIYDDDAIYKGLANEQGNASANTHGINTSSITPDAYNSINLASNNLSNLEFTFDRDYSGSFYIEFQVVETLNNRFVSSDTALEDRRILVTINPTSDTPTLSVANVSGVEDDAFIPLSISGSSTDKSETVTVYVEKPSQVVKFVNTTTNAEVGISTTFDFGSGSINAVALTNAELTNLGIVTGGDVKTNFNLKVKASSLDSGASSSNQSSLGTITVSMESKADPVGIEVNNSSSSSTMSNSDENSAISIPIKLNLNDATENITLSIGNFRDASGNLLSTDRSLETAFRPTGFDDVSTISLNNGFFTFNSVSMSSLVSDAIAGNQFTVNFLPITNFNGLITFDVYATSIEPNAVTSSNASSQTSVITLTQTIDPVSQTPEVSVNDVNVVEFTNDSSIDNVATYKTALSNITVSLSDTTNLTEVKVNLSVANDPGFTLDTSGITSFNSSYNYTVSTTSPLSIKVNGTVADGSSIGSDLVADMTTLLSEIKLVPPEDYSGTSTITTSVTSKETGAEESQPATQTFDIAVSAVAETPTVTGSAATSATLKEDTDILLDLNVTVNDKDGSETVSQVRISGLTSIGEQNLTAILVDGNGNLVGSNDGSGTTILTSAEYSAARAGTTPIFFRPPRDFSGDVSLNIVAVVQEPSSGSTATSATSSINFTLTPVSEEASASSNDVSVVEFTNTSVDNVATYKTDLSNITVSLSDTSNLGEVKVALSVAKDPDGLVDNETLGAAGNFSIDGILSSAASSDLNSTVNISSTSNNASVTFTITGTDASGNAQTETITGVNNNTVEGTKYFKTITQISSDAAASGVNVGASPGFTLDTSGVTTFGSSYDYTVSTTSPLSIKVNGTVADKSSIGADLVADMTTLLSELKLVPPEDFSGTATISTSVTSTETGAGESPPANDSFEITVSAVAEAPTVTGAAATSANLKEDLI
jgi:hypothetical protein